MSVTTHFYMVISDLTPRPRDRLRYLAAQQEPPSLQDTDLAPGWPPAWADVFQLLWSVDVLERVGWGLSARFQIKV